MLYTVHEQALRSSGPTAVDSPDRLRSALSVLEVVPAEPVPASIVLDDRWLEAAHSPGYLQGLAALAQYGGSHPLDPELIFDADMWAAARAAAAACAGQALAAWQDPAMLRMCLSRPGSHHAGRAYALGGCVLNNLAVAAHAVLAAGARRVAVIDFDIHHGNGTEEIFYDDPRVLTISLHAHPFFPGTGDPARIGVRAGVGANLNLPLSLTAGPADALDRFAVAASRVRWFRPELVLFEAGFDGHTADWTSYTRLDDATYAAFGTTTRALLSDVGAGACIELGGGYTDAAIRGGLRAFLHGLGVA